MPPQNAYRHQHYPDGPPAAPFRLLTPPPQPEVDSAVFHQRLRAVGQVLRQAGVTSIILVHGTFVGDDYFDIALLLERASPAWAAAYRRFSKRQPDWLLQDAGNYTREYAERMAAGINVPGERPIDVRRFIWSGGNSHLPRAMAAVRLIEEIASLPPAEAASSAPSTNGSPGAPRVLCFSHSHGANALALMSNLLGGNRNVRRQLLELVRNVPGPNNGGLWLKRWHRACELLDSDLPAAELLGGRRLDLVTLGIPIRYGWDTAGYDHLLHIINQRLVPGLPPWRGRLPRTLGEVVDGRYGDWVQQLGTAGSNFPLVPLRWGRWRGERNLAALLQQGEPSWRVLRRIRQSLRVSDEGLSLLVDYGPAKRGHRLRHIFGHGVYTQTEWMPFHLEQAAAEFYGGNVTGASSPCPRAIGAPT